MRRKRVAFIGCLGACLATAFLFGVSTSNDTRAQSDAAVAPGHVHVDFPGSDIRDVLKFYAVLTARKPVLSSDLPWKRSVTIKRGIESPAEAAEAIRTALRDQCGVFLTDVDDGGKFFSVTYNDSWPLKPPAAAEVQNEPKPELNPDGTPHRRRLRVLKP